MITLMGMSLNLSLIRQISSNVFNRYLRSETPESKTFNFFFDAMTRRDQVKQKTRLGGLHS